MKTIGLIRDGRSYWRDIEKFLGEVNASIVQLDLRSVIQGLPDNPPDLIIAGERSYREVASMALEIPRLIMKEGDVAETKSRGLYFLKWPTTKEAFLEMTSRLLYISDRRLFKTVITLSYKDRKETFLGKSLNFSLTGMAFRVDKILETGDILTVNFYVPNLDERLSVDAEVMRKSKDPDDGSVYYGARFLDMKKEVRNALEGFVRQTK